MQQKAGMRMSWSAYGIHAGEVWLISPCMLLDVVQALGNFHTMVRKRVGLHLPECTVGKLVLKMGGDGQMMVVHGIMAARAIVGMRLAPPRAVGSDGKVPAANEAALGGTHARMT